MFPDATTTGVPTGTVLTPVNGDFNTSFDGQIIDARDVSGTINVTNNNVTIRNSEAGSIFITGLNCIVEDCNLVGAGIGIVGGDGAVVQRCDISHAENGIWIEANNVVVRDNWLHDFIPYNPATDPHIDGIQIPGVENITNVLIQHNNFDLGHDVNSDIQIGFGGTPASGTLTGNNIDIVDNFLGGGTYNLYFEGNFTAGDVLNNTFGFHNFGYVSGSGENLQHYSGNVDGTSGQPILGGEPPPPPPPPPPDEFVLIVGTSKNNNLIGTSEVDHIFGKDGNDVLTGLGSADQLTGGTGNDRFDFNALADSLPGAADTIMDFVHASDHIDLRTIDANTSLANNQAFVFGGQNSAAISHGVTWHEANGETVVTANVTGGTHVDFELHLAGTGLHLVSTDFLL